jgi:citronellyl-CoA synthetase
LLGEINEKYPFDGYTEKDKTEKVIMRNVLKKGDSFFNTGDLVHYMGFKHTQFVDRLGDTYRWKGENVSTTEVEGIMGRFPGIAEAIVYGVEIPNNSGRAGMAKLILNQPLKDFDFDHLYDFMKKEMPPFAIPLFLRISETTDTTSTMKYLKGPLKTEGYDCDKTSDSLYFLMPDKVFSKITPEIRDNINKGIYRF